MVFMSDKFERTYDGDEIWAKIERTMDTLPLPPGENFPDLATRVTAHVIGARWMADVAAAGLRRGDGELEMWIVDGPVDGARQVRVRGPVRPVAPRDEPQEEPGLCGAVHAEDWPPCLDCVRIRKQ
jgi:hypothetical protein